MTSLRDELQVASKPWPWDVIDFAGQVKKDVVLIDAMSEGVTAWVSCEMNEAIWAALGRMGSEDGTGV